MPEIRTIVLQDGENIYTEEEYQELKDIIKTQEDYINKTLIKDSNLVEKAIKQEREENALICEEIEFRDPSGNIACQWCARAIRSKE